ncbi:ABC transporter permease [Metabacillus indicus]|uniref:ABC transporter permease n=1 Tax=Metabacillus indicus TaxID=246786 RepID=UPI000493748D|nr:ABC transporter permease [Metabacillus indicus]KEZ48165.1 sodium ABC transporter permease [Metabacillus indicus LMG 22858]
MLLNCYLKEMKDCFRDSRTLILTVLLPIILMTGLTLFYERMVSGGEEDTYTLAVEETINQAEAELFTPLKNVELVKTGNPEEAVKEGDAQAAVILDSDFTAKIEDGKTASITMIGDSFSQNSSTLMTLVSGALTAYEKTVVGERLAENGTDPSLIQPLVIEQKEMTQEDPTINLVALLVPMILALAIGIGASPAASDLFAGEKEKKTMEALLMTPVSRTTLLFSKWLAISSLGAITGLITLGVVSLEVAFLTENLRKAVSFGSDAPIIIGMALLISVIYAMFMASVLMLTSIIGKTVKESQSYSSPVLMIGTIPALTTTSIGINEFELHHFAIPVLNLFTILKELLFGVVQYDHILLVLGSNLAVMVIALIVGRILFLKDKWVMN